MEINVLTKNDCCEDVVINATPVEWLIINSALRRYVKDENVHPDDIKKAEKMINAEPHFIEKGTEHG